jgi:hypothetical protein
MKFLKLGLKADAEPPLLALISDFPLPATGEGFASERHTPYHHPWVDSR